MAGPADLIAVLRLRPGIPAAALAATLEISPSRLSRLVAQAGEAVVRLGRARATRYALARTIHGVGLAAPIYEVGADGTPHEAGRLSFVQPDAFWLTYGGEEAPREYLPTFLKECGPSGFLGRHFSARHPELGLPARLESWRSDDHVRAIALRGEDAVGNLIVGTESLARFLRFEEREVGRHEFPGLAQGTSASQHPSSAGGERPKFAAFVEGRHVLVKFAGPGDGAPEQRWRDLLVCEHLALTVVRQAGVALAARSRCFDRDGWRFLEVERFDRVGARGRVGVRSLEAVKVEAQLPAGSWTEAADALSTGARPRVSREDASRVRWLEAFGGLTGNTDRHDGNLSFLRDGRGNLSLAPVYDPAPMGLAPVAPGVVENAWRPEPPLPTALAEWRAAVPAALHYWELVMGERRIDPGLRGRAREAREAVERLAARLFPAP